VFAAELVIDQNLQRKTNQDRVAQIAHEFDWLRFEGPTCRRLADGQLRVVEGQHRVLALRARDPNAICWVFVVPAEYPLSMAEEAGLALAITTNRRGHSSLDKWELRLQRGDPHERLCEEVLRAHGLRLAKRVSADGIACVGVITNLIHKDNQSAEQGAIILNLMLEVIQRAYPRDQPDSSTSRWNADLMRAVGEVCRLNPTLKIQRLATALGDRIAQQWISQGTAVTDQQTWRLIGEAVVNRYNRGLRAEKHKLLFG